MFIRVVRFTDVDAERVREMSSRIDAADGPPEGVTSTGVQVLVDEEQGTAVVLQLFDSMEDLRQGETVFAAMDPSETPGTRVSVDRCELVIDLKT